MGVEVIAAVGLGLAAAGAGGQAYYANQAASASRRAEGLRERMMQEETQRKQRELLRQSIVANSMTRARAGAQGVSFAGSAVPGAYGQTAGEVGRQGTNLYENQVLGSGIFEANRDIASAQGNAATFNAIGQFGNFLVGGSQKIANIGSTVGQQLFGLPSTSQMSWDMGTSTNYYNGPPPPPGFGRGQQYGSVPYYGF